MSNYRLIIGLGNPGKFYQYTRHNLGFLVIDKLAQRHQASPFLSQSRFSAQVSKDLPKQLVLAKPTTYMNRSGEAVGRLKRFYKLANQDILIIYDDADLEFGRLRSRLGGSSGGHQGVQSVISHVGDDFWRLRIGIGQPRRSMPLEKHVLKKFNWLEKTKLEPVLNRAAAQAEEFSQGHPSAITE